MRIRTDKLILSLLILFSFLQADNISVTASVNTTTITLNDILSYSVKISGTRKIDHLPTPEGKNFTVVNGPFKSSNIQIINGKMSTELTYTWQLQPRQKGKLLINGFSVMLEGKKYSTQRVAVNVTKARYQSQQNNSNDPSKGRGRVFIDAIPSKKSAYVGEQIIIEYKLIYNIRVTNYGTEKAPEAKGFWIEEFPDIKNPQSNKIMIDGNQYYAATIKRIALFPTESGKLSIEPLITKCEVVLPKKKRKTNSFFDDPFFSNSIFDRTTVKRVVSSPLTLDIKPLPDYAKSDTLPGVMENVRISGKLDTTEIPRDKALTLAYNISGTGNINAVELPAPRLPDYVEVFPPKVNKTKNNQGPKIRGSATYEYVLIPHKAGKLHIPEIEYTFFDPIKEKYITENTRSFDIDVVKDKNAITVRSGLNKEEIQLLDQDIRYIMKDNVKWQKINRRFYHKPLFILINLGTLLLLIGGFGLNIQQKRVSNNPAILRKNRAMKKAREKLEQIDTLAASESLTMLDSIITGFISDRLNLPEAGLSPQNIKEALTRKKIEQQLVDETYQFLENMELYKYSPGAMENTETDLKTQCKRLLTRLSKVI